MARMGLVFRSRFFHSEKFSGKINYVRVKSNRAPLPRLLPLGGHGKDARGAETPK